ncbi:MAG: glycosyltransferase [Chloroflexota bacterium]
MPEAAPTPTPGRVGPDADDRAWLRDELSVVVRDRRRLESELDATTEELAATKRELGALRLRRSVQLALALSATVRKVAGPFRRRGSAQPASTDAAVTTTAAAAGTLTPDAFRTRLRDRLATADVVVTHVDRADAAPRHAADELAGADVLTVASPAFDIRTLRRSAVTVALVGPDPREWLDAPWLDDFDIVTTTSPASVDAIRAARAKVPVLVADPRDGVIDAVTHWLAAPRIGIAVGIRDWHDAPQWGDLHFGRALQRQFERRGHPTRLHLRPEWADAVSSRDDVSVHLFGLSGRRRLPGQLTITWVISHPERASDEIVGDSDRIYVASESFATELATRLSAPVASLAQATDPERFHPDASGPRHDVLFVGNARGTRRDILADLAPTTLDLAVYGRWRADRIDPSYHRGELIPNEDLHRYYSSAGVVLNDHWPEMRAAGFLSNRLYDALASGACVVSDFVSGIDAAFDGGVATYTEPGELRLLIHDLLRDPGRRRALAERGRAAVLDRHTFEHRAAVILDEAVPAARDSRVR